MAGIKRLANTPPGLPAPAPMQHGHCDGSLPPFGNSQQQHYHYHHHSDRTTGDKHHHTYNQHHQVQLSPVRAALGDLTNALTGSNSNTMAAPVPNKSKKQQQPRTDDQPPPSIPPGPGYPRLSCTQTPKGSRHPPHPADVGIAAHNYMLMCDAAESARPRTATGETEVVMGWVLGVCALPCWPMRKPWLSVGLKQLQAYCCWVCHKRQGLHTAVATLALH